MFFWNSLAFSMIQWMLAMWSLVPLPFLKPAWTSGSSRFTYCWSLAWRILSITLLACEMSKLREMVKDSEAWCAVVHGVTRVGHDWATSLSLFTCMHWRRKWQPTPEFLLENPREGGAWWAAVYGVAQSRTRLKRLSSSRFVRAFLPGSKHLLINKECFISST